MVVVMLALVSSAACRAVPASEPEPGELPPERSGSMEELRSLIREGTVAPVQALVSDSEELLDPLSTDAEGAANLPELGIPAGSDQLESLVRPESPEDLTPELADSGTTEGFESLITSVPPPAPSSIESFSQNPYVRFGERIVVGQDGRITKPFPLQAGRGKKLLHLLALSSGIPIQYSIVDSNAEPTAINDAEVPREAARVVLLENWDFEQYQNFEPGLEAAPTAPSELIIADWLVVTAEEEVLGEVQSFVELFAGSVPQIEIEARVVEVTTTDELDWGVRGPDGSVGIDFPDGTAIDNFGFSTPNVADINEAFLTVGTVVDGVAINAILEAVQTWENVTITTRPKIAVREGGVAEIINTQEVPFFNFSGLNSANETFNATLSFKEVGIKLYAAPRVVGTKTIALNLFIEASQQIGTAIAFFDAEGNQFSSPLIARRQARTVVYLEPGQGLVIGGLESERDVESERRVPILGDLPLLGLLFRSDLTRKERTNVLFIIRPRVLQNADFTQDL